MEQLLWHLLAGRRGSVNRLRIIDELLLEPVNTQQLANRLGVDYRTVLHHLDILTENGLVIRPEGDGYGARLFVSGALRSHLATIDEIRRRVQVRAPGALAKRRISSDAAEGD